MECLQRHCSNQKWLIKLLGVSSLYQNTVKKKLCHSLLTVFVTITMKSKDRLVNLQSQSIEVYLLFLLFDLFLQKQASAPAVVKSLFAENNCGTICNCPTIFCLYLTGWKWKWISMIGDLIYIYFLTSWWYADLRY